MAAAVSLPVRTKFRDAARRQMPGDIGENGGNRGVFGELVRGGGGGDDEILASVRQPRRGRIR